MEKNSMRFFKQTLTIMVVSSLTLFIAGCGSTSNDQGVAFTALGFFALDEDGEIDTDTGVTGVGAILGVGASPVAIGVQNNLCCSFIRTERIKLSYEIPGSGVQPPSTAAPLSAVINNTPSDPGTGGSSLPDTLANDESLRFFSFQPVRAEIDEWLVFNKNSLPPSPFSMVVTATVTGVTSAGKNLETNPVHLAVTVFGN